MGMGSTLVRTLPANFFPRSFCPCGTTKAISYVKSEQAVQ